MSPMFSKHTNVLCSNLTGTAVKGGRTNVRTVMGASRQLFCALGAHESNRDFIVGFVSNGVEGHSSLSANDRSKRFAWASANSHRREYQAKTTTAEVDSMKKLLYLTQTAVMMYKSRVPLSGTSSLLLYLFSPETSARGRTFSPVFTMQSS